ncbi:hypothetical protein O9993_11880 [Vibrio lentus]|nr:hypothetical protein [Vibrio lentus]
MYFGKQTPASNGFLERFINGHRTEHDAHGNHWRPLEVPALTEDMGGEFGVSQFLVALST